MNKSLKCFILIISHLACVAIGISICLYCYNEFLVKTHVETQACSNITNNLTIIKLINSGNIERANEFLNLHIDGGLIVLNSYKNISEVKHKNMVLKTLEQLQEYRSVNPYSPEDTELQKIINKPFSLLGQATNNAIKQMGESTSVE